MTEVCVCRNRWQIRNFGSLGGFELKRALHTICVIVDTCEEETQEKQEGKMMPTPSLPFWHP